MCCWDETALPRVNETEPADVLLTGQFKNTNRVLRLAD